MQTKANISDLFVYPVKSCSANPVADADVRARGLVDDRRWVIVNDAGDALTGREHAAISLIQVSVDNNGLTLNSSGRQAVQIPRPTADSSRQNIQIWSDTVNAVDAGDDAARWLTSLLGQNTRLCFMDELATRRVVDHESSVSFADAYPLLLTNSASLRDLSERVGQELSMLRFRPNIVVETDAAFVEDDWKQIAIGDAVFDVAGPCERCNFTTLDPKTADAHPRQEPLRTLATYRRDQSGAVCFGQNLVPVNSGRISIGDTVQVVR